jgi:Resolvase, N terminal domain
MAHSFCFGRDKDRRANRRALPNRTRASFGEVSGSYRPVLMGGRYYGDRLWIGYRFAPQAPHTIGVTIAERTKQAFGKRVNPHLFRDCAATSIAVHDPDHVRITAALLGHRSFVTTERHSLSGASDQRPAYQQMLADAEAGRFEVVVTEAFDRLGRRLSDVARLYDHLEFRGIMLHAVNIGQVSTMHVGLLGTMAQLYLSDLKEKTRRGQLGRALAGKIPGGKAYGYRLVQGACGERS